MKIKSDMCQVTSDTNRQWARGESVFSRHPSPVTCHRQSGVALVITLILLSVTLVMALAFLAISGRERGSVTTQTDTATTRLAADAGLAAAEAQIAANVLSSTNPYSFGLLVSTNYPPFTYTNAADFTNLFVSPRAPVWLSNIVTHAPENRFYLDLNRNGKDDPNGWVTNVDDTGKSLGTTSFQVGDPEWIGVLERPDQPHGPNNHFIARFAFIALPVGNSLDLNAIHNQALAPPLYPLNVNPMSSLDDGYFRNQGVGSWEINLAAFLADLNTNEWDSVSSGGIYKYQQPNFANNGEAFYDAFTLLTNRYAANYNTLVPVGGNTPNGLFTSATTFPPFQNNIDVYSDGPLQTTTAGINVSGQKVTLPWAGADSTNHFFTPDDLFNTKETASFGIDLQNAGTSFFSGTTNSTYDRYTFYRMLSQLGTDTAPESGKMNLNYDNLDQGSNGVLTVAGTANVTNFVPWQPLTFFTNAADRLLKAYTAQWAVSYYTNDFGTLLVTNNPNFVATFNVTNAFGVTDIPVLVSNQFVYTPAVNRLLQLAANMYDATTTNFYPDIFRPLFMHDINGNVFVVGYERQTNFITGADTANEMNPLQNPDIAPPVEVAALTNLFPANTLIDMNVYGVPWIIGAKKGFPNFNAFSIESAFQLVRKLEVMRDTNAVPQPDIILTNQMYLMNITNNFALSCWNSYRSNYPGPVDILVRCSSSMMLTNDNNLQPPYVFGTNFSFPAEIAPNWSAWNGVTKDPSGSFVIPLNTSVLTLTNAIYVYTGLYARKLLPAGDNPTNYQDAGIRELPHFWLLMTNRLQVAIIDYSAGPNNGRIVDYVQLGGMDSKQLLNSALPENDNNSLWNTNFYAQNNLMGVYNQIHVSTDGSTITGQSPTGSGAWTTGQIPGGPTGDTSPAAQQAFFRGFFAKGGVYQYGDQFYVNPQTAMQAPYTPMAFAIQHTTWEANDPLVHYLASDLAPHTETPAIVDWDPNNLRVTTTRYQPWGIATESGGGIDTNPNNLSFKDPLVYEPGDWDFPTNKLPTVGWLGRVHRGTPWQTVYLKSTNILTWANSLGQNGLNTWATWTGDFNGFDAINSAPVEDRLLFDLFTTAFNDNATRGQLSVNISSNSLAAWSALFSGVTVLSNSAPFVTVEFRQTIWPRPALLIIATNIQPAGVNVNNSALAQIVAGIDQTRATFTNADGLIGTFEREGDILAVPQLTEQSPFLNHAGNSSTGGIQLTNANDEMYEWLPQQAMSLLRVGTQRYVIYSYGQALKPAPNGVYLGAGQFFGMVTNYQVMAETATRAVVRLETVRTNAGGTTIVTPPRAVIESFNILPPD
jgi:hypothetical protein